MDFDGSIKKKLSNIYLLSYIILMISSLLGVYSEYNTNSVLPLPSYIKVIWIVGLLIFFILQFYLLVVNTLEINNYLFYFVLTLFILCFFTVIGLPVIKLRMFTLIVLVMNCNLVNFHRLIRFDFITRVLSILLMVIMYVFKLFPSYIMNSYNFTRPDGTLRAAWGFNHPNALGSYYLGIIISAILLINIKKNMFYLSKKMKILLTLVIFISGYYVEFNITDSRSAQIALFIIYVGWIINIIRDIKCIKAFYGMLIIFLVNIFSIALAFKLFITTNLFFKLNSLFSNRLVLQNNAINDYKINIFGNHLFKVGQPYWIDNQYIYNLLALGIIGSLIFIYIFWEAFKYSYVGNDFILYSILVAIVIKAIFESTTFEYCSLLPILYAFKYRDYSHSPYLLALLRKSKLGKFIDKIVNNCSCFVLEHLHLLNIKKK